MRGALVEVNAGHVELLGDVDAELGVHLDAALGDHRAERLDIVTDHALPRDLLAGLDVDGQGLELDTDGLHRGVGSEQTWSGGEHGQGERCAKDGTAGRSDHGDSVSCSVVVMNRAMACSEHGLLRNPLHNLTPCHVLLADTSFPSYFLLWVLQTGSREWSIQGLPILWQVFRSLARKWIPLGPHQLAG